MVAGLLEAELNIPIGYIPAGSTNDFARTLGIPSDMVKAAEIAVGAAAAAEGHMNINAQGFFV